MPCKEFNYSGSADWPQINTWLQKRLEPDLDVEKNVLRIFQAVRENGDQALIEYTRKFDCPCFESNMLRVSSEKISNSIQDIPQKDQDILEQAAANIGNFHQKQKENSWITTDTPGLITGQIIRPVKKAGLYVPGGQSGETPLVSSILMNVIPAQVAGVKEIHIVTPPRKDGSINPYTLATAHLLGVDDIYPLGSAWAIAALAFSTQTVPKVDVIAGPGNIYVATAKRLLIGQIGIDMLAGPSEILILADESAEPKWLAADLLSQAEHDSLASAILISPSEEILHWTKQELNQQLTELPRQKIAAQALQDWGGLIGVSDLDTGIDLINRLAPEHLELCLNNPWDHLTKIENAGAIFLGHNSPESLGDYFAGPNHVLPTNGTARFSSALSVDDFCKKSSILSAEPLYMQKQAAKIARLARLEGLEAHARSAEKRLSS